MEVDMIVAEREECCCLNQAEGYSWKITNQSA